MFPCVHAVLTSRSKSGWADECERKRKNMPADSNKHCTLGQNSRRPTHTQIRLATGPRRGRPRTFTCSLVCLSLSPSAQGRPGCRQSPETVHVGRTSLGRGPPSLVQLLGFKVLHGSRNRNTSSKQTMLIIQRQSILQNNIQIRFNSFIQKRP